jgi:iron complex outermembrane receptor protein
MAAAALHLSIHMKKNRMALALALAFPLACPLSAFAQADVDAASDEQAPIKSLGVVTVNSSKPSSLPRQIPTTLASVTATEMKETVNATDSEDALKYLPSLLVRKRYVGDYNHAVLSSRASGTGNSARSAVYADGILLSNFLGNGASYAPRWGLVTPEEIERVDVMYGPFSAAYPGNSAGAIVDYVTRMPKQFEAHIKVSAFNQHFDTYQTDSHFGGHQSSASLGSRAGDWSWWLNLNHLDSSGQPQVFALKSVTPVGASGNGTLVTGGVYVKDAKNNDVLAVGTTTQYHTVQDHAKIKLAYDLSGTLRASYTLGYWQNSSDGRPSTYLRNAATGEAFYSGTANDGVNKFTVGTSDFTSTQDSLVQVMHGLSLKSNTQGVFDWEFAASLFDYQQDQSRKSGSNSATTLSTSGTGTLTDQGGTGWNNQALKGTWRPGGKQGEHIIDFGYQHDDYHLGIDTRPIADATNWQSAATGSSTSRVGGQSEMHSLYGQDVWAFAPRWKAVVGARLEDWFASGYTKTYTAGVQSAASTDYAQRHEQHVSPKAALSFQWDPSLVIKASNGRAVRMPTVQELYGSTTTANSQFVNDPTLRPERSWTSELSAEKDLGSAMVRVTAFIENVRDSLYSQTTLDSTLGLVTRVSNVDRIATQGVELFFLGDDVVTHGLDLSGSLTYADSRIKANSGYVVTPGDTVGKFQPRVPVWRATALANYHWNDRLSTSLGARYSGRQFSTLNNADVNGDAYTAASKYFTVDVRLLYKLDKQWSAALGIDNLNNARYWNYHQYPHRTMVAELRFDL